MRNESARYRYQTGTDWGRRSLPAVTNQMTSSFSSRDSTFFSATEDQVRRGSSIGSPTARVTPRLVRTNRPSRLPAVRIVRHFLVGTTASRPVCHHTVGCLLAYT